MKKRVTALMALAMALAVGIANATDVKKGTTAAQFLKIGVGARAVGMGDAYVGVAADASAIYWNPAGLARMRRNEVQATHADWIAGINFEHVGLAMPLSGFGTIGASVTVLHMGDMPVTTARDPEGLSGQTFGASDLAVGLAYAKDLTDHFSIGVVGKYIRQSIFHSTATGMALDVGTLYDTGFKGIKVGMCFSNFGGTMQMRGRDLLVDHDVSPTVPGNEDVDADLRTGSWELPINFRVGIATNVVQNENSRLTVALDGNHPNDAAQFGSLGVEYTWRNMVSLRGGYKGFVRQGNQSFQDAEGDAGFSFGAGLDLNYRSTSRVAVEYAYASFGRLDYVQRFSLAFGF